MKKLVSLLMAVTMLFTAVPMFAADTTDYSKIRFTDVNEGDWYYDAVMNLARKGAISGLTLDKNTMVGTFGPNEPITDAQFLVLVMNATMDTNKMVVKESYYDSYAKQAGTKWWTKYYAYALENSIIVSHRFDVRNMDKQIDRLGMAEIIVRALRANLNEPLIDTNGIENFTPDARHSSHSAFIKQMVAKGIMSLETDGHFDTGKGTRAQAAVIIERLTDKSKRNPLDLSRYQTNSNPIIIKEGEMDGHRLAMPGDTYNRKDGSSVILEIDPATGVLGGHQFVSPNLGAMYDGAILSERRVDFSELSLGQFFSSRDGNVTMWTSEWYDIKMLTKPTHIGKNGEVVGWWKWSDDARSEGEPIHYGWMWMGSND